MLTFELEQIREKQGEEIGPVFTANIPYYPNTNFSFSFENKTYNSPTLPQIYQLMSCGNACTHQRVCIPHKNQHDKLMIELTVFPNTKEYAQEFGYNAEDHVSHFLALVYVYKNNCVCYRCSQPQLQNKECEELSCLYCEEEFCICDFDELYDQAEEYADF